MQAQQNWRQFEKQARESLVVKEYFKAGTYFYLAWEQKPAKEELLYEAATAFFSARAYKESAEAYSKVLTRTDLDPLILVKYARSLKLDGNYTEAERIFREFRRIYTRQFKDENQTEEEIQTDASIIALTDNEIVGCELAKQMKEDGASQHIHISLPRSRLNSPGDDMSPLLVDPVTLLYTSGKFRNRHVLRSDNDEELWSEGGQTLLPGFIADQAGSLTFSTDGNTVYFSRCTSYASSMGYLDEGCRIYFAVREPATDTWSQPKPLPSIINAPDANTAYPQFVERGDKEILFFSSDRSGSTGFMDVWFAIRDKGAAVDAFETVKNAGPQINTLGNDVSPFFDVRDNILYFSSNGHVSIGGLDVYSASCEGTLDAWREAVNLGTPINSHAHDLFYYPYMDGRSGFLSSNRYFDTHRTNTRDFDLFRFTSTHSNLLVYGASRLAADATILINGVAYLYEILPNGQEKVMESMSLAQGRYAFSLKPDRDYVVEVNQYGFKAQRHSISTKNWQHYVGLALDFYFDDHADDLAITQQTTERNYGEYWQKGRSLPTGDYPDNLPKDEIGITYRVQVAALKKFDPADDRLVLLERFGKLGWQVRTDKPTYRRVYIGAFGSLEKAIQVRDLIRAFPDFKEAFVVRFENSQRIGKADDF